MTLLVWLFFGLSCFLSSFFTHHITKWFCKRKFGRKTFSKATVEHVAYQAFNKGRESVDYKHEDVKKIGNELLNFENWLQAELRKWRGKHDLQPIDYWNKTSLISLLVAVLLTLSSFVRAQNCLGIIVGNFQFTYQYENDSPIKEQLQLFADGSVRWAESAFGSLTVHKGTWEQNYREVYLHFNILADEAKGNGPAFNLTTKLSILNKNQLGYMDGRGFIFQRIK